MNIEHIITNINDQLQTWKTQFVEHGWMNPTFLTIVVIALLTYCTKKPFYKLMIKLFKRMENPLQLTFEEDYIKRVEKHLRNIWLISGIYLMLSFLHIPDSIDQIIYNILKSFLILNVVLIISQGLNYVTLQSKVMKKRMHSELLEWSRKILQVIIWMTVIFNIASIWGLDTTFLMTGSGVIGAAIAFGAQDLFKNILAGITILSEKKFKKGEHIKVNGVVEGIVMEIGFRSSLIRSFESYTIMVPNEVLANQALQNISRRKNRRIIWEIGLEYRTNIMQLKNIQTQILQYIQQEPWCLTGEQDSYGVMINEFTDSAINIRVYCFFDTKQWKEYLNYRQQLILAIKEIVEKQGAGFAFPSQSIYHEIIPEININEQHNI